MCNTSDTAQHDPAILTYLSNLDVENQDAFSDMKKLAEEKKEEQEPWARFQTN